MKKLVLGMVLAMGMTTAFAQDLNLSGGVSVGSRFLYRGLELNPDATVGVDGKVDNILTPGLYVAGQINTLSTSPINQTTTRSDVGFGYHNSFGIDGFDADVSLHRVWNPSQYASSAYVNPYLNVFQNNYNEVRGTVSYNFGPAKVYGQIGQIVSTGFSRDTYAAAGVETNALLPDLTVGALVSGEHYRNASVTRLNNTELYASYKVWKGLSAEARYSIGGRFVDDSKIDNRGYVGVRYNF